MRGLPKALWRRHSPARALWVLALGLAWLSSSLSAHPAAMTGCLLKVEPDGSLQVDLRFNALAFVINDDPQHIPDSAFRETLESPMGQFDTQRAEADLRLQRGLMVLCDANRLDLRWTHLPTSAEIRAQTNPLSTVLLEATATARLPAGSHVLRLRLPEVIGTVVVSVSHPGREDVVSLLQPGETSPAFDVSIQEEPSKAPSSRLQAFAQFVAMGFKHILPEGLDHILFVLGLFLLSARWRSLLAQVTAFTLAHSVTLGLSLYGVVSLKSAIVEPLIALSIVLVAWDNLRSTQVRSTRLLVVFGFGLIHGLGFAGALQDLHLERSQLSSALVGFNLGIELGQLAVIAVAFLAVGWARNLAHYRRCVTIPASVAIGAVAIAWTIQRLL